jgi:hypothetical protein
LSFAFRLFGDHLLQVVAAARVERGFISRAARRTSFFRAKLKFPGGFALVLRFPCARERKSRSRNVSVNPYDKLKQVWLSRFDRQLACLARSDGAVHTRWTMLNRQVFKERIAKMWREVQYRG